MSQLSPNPNTGSITIVSTDTQDNSKNFANNYALYNNGTLKNESGATLDNNGSLYNESGATLDNYGSLKNKSGANLYNFFFGTLKNESGATLDNYGYLYNYYSTSTLDNYGSLKNESGATLYNNGTLYNESGATLDNSGYLYNYSALDNYGSLKNESGAILLNDGTINQYTGSSFTNNGTLAGSGTFNGSITLNSGSTLAPGGYFFAPEYVDSIGKFTVNGGINLSGGTIKLSVTGVNSGEYDSLIANSIALNSGKLQISISNSDLNNINNEIAVGQTRSIQLLTVSGGLNLTSAFVTNGIISPISGPHDVFKLAKSGNSLLLNIKHI